MSKELFSIGSEYAVNIFGNLYYNGELMEGPGSHLYGISVRGISFVEIRKKGNIERYIDIKFGYYCNLREEQVRFEENSPDFYNLDWTSYKKKLKKFFFIKEGKKQWGIEKVEGFFELPYYYRN